MTKDQVQKLREVYLTPAKRPDGKNSTLGEYIRFCLDGNIDFVTSKDFIMFDDDNNMLHCIAINEDMRAQPSYPFKMISCDYGVIQQIEAVMSRINFSTFLDTSFVSSIMSKEKKEYIKKWADDYKSQALQPIRATPYYEHKPNVISMPHSVINRDDDVKEISSPSPIGIHNPANDKKENNE